MATTRTYPPPDRAAAEAALREAVRRLNVRAYLTADLIAEANAPRLRRRPKDTRPL